MTRAWLIRLAVSAAMTAIVVLLCGQPLTAGALSFTLKGGRVTILAYNVTVREILAEWARLGGVSIVGSDNMSGAPVTVELWDIPEAKALDVLLRSVSGYVVVSRSQPVAVGSTLQSIRILPTSRAPSLPPPMTAQAPPPREPLSTVFSSVTVAPATTPFTPPGARPPVARGAVERGERPVASSMAGDAGSRFAPLNAVEQAALRQNRAALQDFLGRGTGGNNPPAPTTMRAPAASTDSSRPGSITPYPPPDSRPSSPQAPRK